MDAAAASFVLGLLSTASPCVLPLFPGFLAYLSGQSETRPGARPYLLGLVVLVGVLSTMLALGALIAALAVPIGSTLAIVVPVADGLILALGVALLLNRNPFKTLPQIRVPILRGPLANAYLYGVVRPDRPALPVRWWSVFALSFTVDEAWRLWCSSGSGSASAAAGDLAASGPLAALDRPLAGTAGWST
jgi:cytochrome c-type biogenesis protein